MQEKDEALRFQPGDIVRHFKREFVDPAKSTYLYEIVSWARHSETDERYVVYRALYGSRETWVRPYAMFMEKVDRQKYPDVRQEFRFERFEGSLSQ